MRVLARRRTTVLTLRRWIKRFHLEIGGVGCLLKSVVVTQRVDNQEVTKRALVKEVISEDVYEY